MKAYIQILNHLLGENSHVNLNPSLIAGTYFAVMCCGLYQVRWGK